MSSIGLASIYPPASGLVIGNSTIGATNKPFSFFAYSGSNQSLNTNGDTVLDLSKLTTVKVNTCGSTLVLGANSSFTPTISGFYYVSASAYVSIATQQYLTISGVFTPFYQYTTAGQSATVSGLVYLTSGQKLQYILQNNGGSGTYNLTSFSITPAF